MPEAAFYKLLPVFLSSMDSQDDSRYNTNNVN